MDTTMHITAKAVASDIVKVEVMAESLPADFFGAAFDLKIDGAEWSLYRYEAGNVFTESGVRPLLLATEKEKSGNRIIAGISLKAGDTVLKDLPDRDVSLVVFYLRVPDAGEMQFSFENHIVSSLKGGKRIDIGEVEWRSTKFDLSSADVEKETGLDGEASVLSVQSPVSPFLTWPDNQSVQSHLLWGLVFALIAVFAFYLCFSGYLRRLRNKKIDL